MFKKIVSGLALSLSLAGSASAAVVLDQATIPQTGHIPSAGSVGWAIGGGQVIGQTFTVGVAGYLDTVSLGLENWYGSNSDSKLEILNASNVVLFATHIASAQLPVFDFAGIDASQALSVSVRDAHIQVAAGDVLMLKLSGEPGAGFRPVWRASNANGLISYAGGQAYTFNGAGGGPFPIMNEFAFRTYVDDMAGSAVPEPGAWAMLLVGFGVLGSGLRIARRAGVLAVD